MCIPVASHGEDQPLRVLNDCFQSHTASTARRAPATSFRSSRSASSRSPLREHDQHPLILICQYSLYRHRSQNAIGSPPTITRMPDATRNHGDGWVGVSPNFSAASRMGDTRHDQQTHKARPTQERQCQPSLATSSKRNASCPRGEAIAGFDRLLVGNPLLSDPPQHCELLFEPEPAELLDPDLGWRTNVLKGLPGPNSPRPEVG